MDRGNRVVNFDEILDRKGDYTVKYDLMKSLFGRDDLIPLWVADMEFKSPECIENALRKMVDTGIFGYNVEPPELKDSIVNWLDNIQGWKVEKEWISYIPAVVRGLSFVIHYFTHKGDKVIVQTPVYHPFMNVPKDNDRELVFNPLRLLSAEGGKAGDIYEMDFEHLEKIAGKNDCKLLILCNPHNPGGIGWSVDTLRRLADICHRHGIIVVSDEIHADLTLWGGRHIPFASVSREAAQISITFGAPSKTFNMPGLSSSYSIIPNPAIREGFYHWLTVNEYNAPMIMTSLATMAVYKDGNEWRKQVISYIEGNILFMEEFFKKHFPDIKVIRPDASYLVWIDCRQFVSTREELEDFFTTKARLAVNYGFVFGPEGELFVRINVACPRAMLSEALERLTNNCF